jgi:hypothetical protein
MPLSARRVLKQFKYAMYFDGVDDYVSVASSPSLNLTSLISIEAWVMTFKRTGQQIIIKNYVPHRSYNMFLYAVNAGYPALHIFDTNNRNYSVTYWTPYPILQMHQLVGTFNGRYLKLYMDASLKATTDIGTTVQMRVFDEPLFIAREDFYYCNHMIPLIRIYSRDISFSEIQWNYNYPDNPVRNGLVLWLQAHPDYVKDIDNDGVLEWIDLSGFGNHGKIYGAQLVQLIKSPARTLSSIRALTATR